MDRQLRLNCNNNTLDLTSTPYKLEAGTWGSAGELLAFSLIVEATTLAQVERYANDVRRWLAQAATWKQVMAGDAVYVETKVCDEISTMAELGAGWQRKLVHSGVLEHEDVSVRATGNYALSMQVSLVVAAQWERAAAASMLTASSASTVVRTDGGLTVPAAATLTARRIAEIGGGFTVRARWLYSDNDCTFFNAEAGANDVKAYYQASDKKLYMQDSAGTTAASSALTTAAGTELDLVFKFDPVTPKMGIWVNGSANGTAATCVLDFGSYGSELILYGGFEAGGTGGNFNGGAEVDDGTSDTFTGWTNVGVDDVAGNKIEATATAHAGSYAVKITTATVQSYTYLYVSLAPGKTYKASVYSRGDASVGGNWYFQNVATGAVLGSFNAGAIGTDYTESVQYYSHPISSAAVSVILVFSSSYLVTAGVCYFDAVSVKQVLAPDTYQVFAPSTAAQTLLSWQCWPAALTDAECAGLYAWGRPEPELAYMIAPADADNTDSLHKLYNVPGTAPAPLRVVAGNYSSATDYDQVAYGLRPLRIQTTHLWECESGTMGTDTANNANAAASGGNQARFTPTDTAYATRVTVAICANPADVAAMQGRYRLYLACNDSAAAVGINLLKWRLTVAGLAEEYSEEFQATAVATRLLLDLGTLELPPGAWPEESIDATTDVVTGTFIGLEIQMKNTTGGGGGVFDLDAIYLAPAEAEGVATCADLDNTDEYLVLDWASSPEAFVSVRDYRSMEFATWASCEGDELKLPPVAGAVGTLWLYAYRDTTDQAYPNDDLVVWLYYRARWV